MSLPTPWVGQVKEGDLYYLEWVDAATLGGHEWREKREIDSLQAPHIKTVGWVHKVTDTSVLIVSTMDLHDTNDPSYWGEMMIPLGCITKKRKLR